MVVDIVSALSAFLVRCWEFVWGTLVGYTGRVVPNSPQRPKADSHPLLDPFASGECPSPTASTELTPPTTTCERPTDAPAILPSNELPPFEQDSAHANDAQPITHSKVASDINHTPPAHLELSQPRVLPRVTFDSEHLTTRSKAEHVEAPAAKPVPTLEQLVPQILSASPRVSAERASGDVKPRPAARTRSGGLPRRVSICWPRTILVMRHGERADQACRNWTSTAERPWDPPLSEAGRSECTLRGQQLAADASVCVDSVITSPFTRCIESSMLIMDALGLPASRLHVHPGMCEWLSIRNLNLDPRQSGSARLSDAMEEWFWKPQTAEAGVRAAVARHWSHEAAEQVNIVGDLRFPPLGEAQHAAHARFWATVQDIACSFAGCTLVVTHGDAVAAMVERAQPGCTVYEVRTTGYIQLKQTSPKDDIVLEEGVSVGWIDVQ